MEILLAIIQFILNLIASMFPNLASLFNLFTF